MIPLVWSLTPKKTQEVYEKIFKVLKKKAVEYGCQLKPQQVYLDFESGAINALEKNSKYEIENEDKFTSAES